MAVVTGLTHNENDLLWARRVRRVLHPLLRGARPARYPGIVAGDGDDPPHRQVALKLKT